MSVRKTQHIKSINNIEAKLHRIKDKIDPVSIHLRKELFKQITDFEVKLKYNLD